MKKVLTLLLIINMALLSCKKNDYKMPDVASLTLINTVTAGKSVKLGSRVATIANNASAQLAINVGEEDLYVWPVGDSAHPYYTYYKFSAESRGVYSLFMGGTEADVIGVLIKEDIPYRTDSTGGIRFINLSPNSPPLNVVLKTTPSINEVSNLNYQQYTEFKSYPGFASTIPYSFQITNASTGTVLFTYNFTSSNLPRFSNITLVIRGMVGVSSGNQAFGVTRVAQDR
jgi:hypothetical protein